MCAHIHKLQTHTLFSSSINTFTSSLMQNIVFCTKKLTTNCTICLTQKWETRLKRNVCRIFFSHSRKYVLVIYSINCVTNSMRYRRLTVLVTHARTQWIHWIGGVARCTASLLTNSTVLLYSQQFNFVHLVICLLKHWMYMLYSEFESESENFEMRKCCMWVCVYNHQNVHFKQFPTRG